MIRKSPWDTGFRGRPLTPHMEMNHRHAKGTKPSGKHLWSAHPTVFILRDRSNGQVVNCQSFLPPHEHALCVANGQDQPTLLTVVSPGETRQHLSTHSLVWVFCNESEC